MTHEDQDMKTTDWIRIRSNSIWYRFCKLSSGESRRKYEIPLFGNWVFDTELDFSQPERVLSKVKPHTPEQRRLLHSLRFYRLRIDPIAVPISRKVLDAVNWIFPPSEFFQLYEFVPSQEEIVNGVLKDAMGLPVWVRSDKLPF